MSSTAAAAAEPEPSAENPSSAEEEQFSGWRDHRQRLVHESVQRVLTGHDRRRSDVHLEPGLRLPRASLHLPVVLHAEVVPHPVQPGILRQRGLFQRHGLRLLPGLCAASPGAGLRIQRRLGLLGLQRAKRFVEAQLQLRLSGLQRSDHVVEVPGFVNAQRCNMWEYLDIQGT